MFDFFPRVFMSSETAPYRKSLTERWRDWDWNFLDLLSYAWDTILFHIHANGWIGYILVPLIVWVLLLYMPGTRYIASLISVDVWRNTLANFIGVVFRALTGAATYGFGIMIASMRSATRFFTSLLK